MHIKTHVTDRWLYMHEIGNAYFSVNIVCYFVNSPSHWQPLTPPTNSSHWRLLKMSYFLHSSHWFLAKLEWRMKVLLHAVVFQFLYHTKVYTWTSPKGVIWRKKLPHQSFLIPYYLFYDAYIHRWVSATFWGQFCWIWTPNVWRSDLVRSWAYTRGKVDHWTRSNPTQITGKNKV